MIILNASDVKAEKVENPAVDFSTRLVVVVVQ